MESGFNLVQYRFSASINCWMLRERFIYLNFFGMKNFIFLFAMGLLFWAGSCDNSSPIEATTGITINFKAVYGNEPLIVSDEEYDYEEGMKVRFETFNYYLSDIVLLRDETGVSDETEVTEVSFFDFSEMTDLDKANEGLNLISSGIPVGDYAGIKFGVGVKADLNRTQPGDYSTSHPMHNPSNYWSSANGYIFMKIEGNADTLNVGDWEWPLIYHIGSDDFYREITFPKNITLKEGEQFELDFEVDLRQVLITEEGFHDIKEVPIDHTVNIDVASKLMRNLGDAFILH